MITQSIFISLAVLSCHHRHVFIFNRVIVVIVANASGCICEDDELAESPALVYRTRYLSRKRGQSNVNTFYRFIWPVSKTVLPHPHRKHRVCPISCEPQDRALSDPLWCSRICSLLTAGRQQGQSVGNLHAFVPAAPCGFAAEPC